MFSVV
jgi:hypothetical protein